MEQLADKSIAILGAGTMGSLLAESLLKNKIVAAEQLRATVRHTEHASALSSKLNIEVTTDNAHAAEGAGVVLICVKPSGVASVLHQIRGALRYDALVISIATAVTTATMEEVLGKNIAVVRAMPNTPCRIGQGMTVLCRGQHAASSQMAIAEHLFSVMGKTAQADEHWMDAVTALSASGPAFVFTAIEALAEGGVRAGLPRDLATLLAAQATLGAAAMVLESGQHPALLKSEVTTPGGCTVDGLMELEDGKIRATLIRAIATTTAKAGKIARPASAV
jgi:pyrroline-5-carboxylate reductase